MSARDQFGSQVHCYGCGADYDADPVGQGFGGGEKATEEHTHHLGPVHGPLVPAEQLVAWLEECQRERDTWLRYAYGWEG
jgi:hypothetical protein